MLGVEVGVQPPLTLAVPPNLGAFSSVTWLHPRCATRYRVHLDVCARLAKNAAGDETARPSQDDACGHDHGPPMVSGRLTLAHARAKRKMERRTGLEPATSTLGGSRSTN